MANPKFDMLLSLEIQFFSIRVAEITAKIANLKCCIYEIDMSYTARTYVSWKKISWSDGI